MKIATICAPDMAWFLDGIESVFARQHEVRRFVIATAQQLRDALEWADVVWCEFANQIAAAASRSGHPALIVRMHSYEAYGEVAAVDWSGVAHLVVTSQHVHDIAKEAAPAIADVPTTLIPSAVDTERFQLQPQRRRDGTTRIGLVAWVRPEKNVHGALEILRQFRDMDDADHADRYFLDIAGECDHPAYRRYLDHAVRAMKLGGAVRFLGHVEDIPAFWREHDFCLSASLREGHPYNVLEAMACGVRPVVHEYLGAAAQFPADVLWQSHKDAFGQILCCRAEQGQRWRDVLAERGYTLDAQAPRLLGLIDDVGGKLTASAAAPIAADAGSDSPPSTIDLPESATLCWLAMIAKVNSPSEMADMRRAIRSVRDVTDEAVVVLDDRSLHVRTTHIDGALISRREFLSFSDQRNHAASLCAGEWLLVLDADDYFESVGDLRACMANASPDATVIECEEVSVDENGREVDRGTAIVAYRRNAHAWKFHGHNELRPYPESGQRVFSTAVMVYRCPQNEDQAAHARRTIPLLMKDLEENPRDPHAPYFLARMHYILEDWPEVAHWADMTIKLAPKSVGHSPAWYLLCQAVEKLHGRARMTEVLDAGFRAHPGSPDLIDLCAMVWKGRWVSACANPQNPYLRAHQFTPRLLPRFVELSADLGWPTTPKARTA